MNLDLYLITRCKNYENLPYMIKALEENLRYCREVNGEVPKILWEVVFDLDRLEAIPSRIIKALDSIHAKINFSTGDNVLNECIYQVDSVTNWVHVWDDETIINKEIFSSFYQNKDSELPVLIFRQIREDGSIVPETFSVRVTAPIAKGVLDFSQIIFKASALSAVGGFKTDFAAAGSTVDAILAEAVKTNPRLGDLLIKGLTTRSGLLRTSTASKPKVVTKLGVSIKNNEDSKLEIIPVNPRLLREESKLKSFIVSDQLDIDADSTYNEILLNILRSGARLPMFSIYTSAYNIGERILQTWETIKAQTYQDWEWVIVNDSQDGGATQKILDQISLEDSRVRVYQFSERSRGNIGEAKFRAAGLCRGNFLAELDHDDLLLPDTLQRVHEASLKFPDAGFFYTDCAEVDQNYNCPLYPEGFALGYGSYRKENYIGIEWDAQNTVPTNPHTIRHIVGVPNHLRCWKREIYHSIGGYNRLMRIADDYELIVRTFLVTKFCRIAKMLYIQRYDGKNSQDKGNRDDIQLKVREIAKFYNEAIRGRFLTLGVVDYVYDELKRIQPLWFIPHRPNEENYNVNYVYEVPSDAS